MERTWKPKAAGILSIIGGALGLFFGILVGLPAVLLAIAMQHPEWALAAVFLCATPFVLGIVAIIGGGFTLSRRRWGWALAGSIAATFTTLLPGIASIILIALSKREFA